MAPERATPLGGREGISVSMGLAWLTSPGTSRERAGRWLSRKGQDARCTLSPALTPVLFILVRGTTTLSKMICSLIDKSSFKITSLKNKERPPSACPWHSLPCAFVFLGDVLIQGNPLHCGFQFTRRLSFPVPCGPGCVLFGGERSVEEARGALQVPLQRREGLRGEWPREPPSDS